MKVQIQKWCWVGLILCVGSSAWARKGDDDQTESDTKKVRSAKSDSQSAKSDSQDEANNKDDTKDDTADEEEAPKPPPKKAAHKAKKAAAPAKKDSVINLGLLGSYGASTFTRLGFGLRGGVTLGEHEGLYIGATGTLFLGTSVTQERLTKPNAERTRRSILLGADVGYDLLATTDVYVRPYMNLGLASVTNHTCATGDCWDEPDHGVHLTIAPGFQGIYDMGGFYLGADLHYQIIFGVSDASAATMSLTAGMRL